LVLRLESVYVHRPREVATLYLVTLTAVHLATVKRLDVVALHIEKIEPYLIVLVGRPFKRQLVGERIGIGLANRSLVVLLIFTSRLHCLVGDTLTGLVSDLRVPIAQLIFTIGVVRADRERYGRSEERRVGKECAHRVW